MQGFSLCSRAKARWGILTGSRVLNRIYNTWNVLCQVNEVLLIHKKGSVNSNFNNLCVSLLIWNFFYLNTNTYRIQMEIVVRQMEVVIRQTVARQYTVNDMTGTENDANTKRKIKERYH